MDNQTIATKLKKYHKREKRLMSITVLKRNISKTGDQPQVLGVVDFCTHAGVTPRVEPLQQNGEKNTPVLL